MVSRTCVTENRRARKKKNGGAKRKAEMKNKGTTPKFAIHPNGKPSAATTAAKK